VKKRIALAVLLVLAVAGLDVYLGIRKAGEEARAYEVEEMSAPEIAAALRSPELTKRLDAVAQLDKLTDAEKKAAFLRSLGASHPAARLTALTQLQKGHRADPEVVTAVLTVAREDPDPDVVESAFTLLVGSGDPRVLAVAAGRLLATDASLAAKLSAARTLDALTGRSTAENVSELDEAAEGAADDLGIEWDAWIEEHASKLQWNAERQRFE
jgi:hypothetical protein